MVDGKKQTVVNALIGLAAVIISIVIIIILSVGSGRYENDAVDRSYNYARNAERQISTDCSRVTSPDRVKCANEAVQAARENQRKEQDLAAQWVAAWWTKVTGAAALVGVILSAFGVFLVWRTFRATREGNQITRDTGQAQVRAYLSLNVIDLIYHGSQRFEINLAVKNSGQTPAHNPHIKFWAQIIPADKSAVTVVLVDGGSEYAALGDMSAQEEKSQTFAFDIPDTLVRPGNTLSVLVEVICYDVFRVRQEYRASFHCKDLKHRNPLEIIPHGMLHMKAT